MDDNPYVIVGNDDFSRKLANYLGTRHVNCYYKYYPHEPLFGVGPGVEYDELKGKYGILVARFEQTFAGEHQSELSHLILGVLALCYDLFRSYRMEKVDVLLPCLPINKQDHIPSDDPDVTVRDKDKGKVPLLEFFLNKLYPARVVTYHGHHPELRCGEGKTNLWGYDIVSLSLVEPIVERLKKYEELSDPTKVYVVCADKKKRKFSRIFADELGGPKFATLDVSRTDPSESESYGTVDVRGLHAVVIDDTYHTGSASTVVVESIKNPASITIVNIHSPVAERGWERLQEELLTDKWGVPVRYLTTPTVKLSPEFTGHPMIDVIDLEGLVSVAGNFYKDQYYKDKDRK